MEAANTSAMFAAILNAQAVLIDSLVDDSRKSIGKSAVADVRRSIRLNADAIPTMMDVALANAATCTPSYRNAVLIGTIIDVSLRLKTRSDGKSMVEAAEARLTDYYLKNIVSSRTAVHTAALDSFNDFISHIVTKPKFEAEYLPVLDKMMLRSPEIVLLGKGFFCVRRSVDHGSLIFVLQLWLASHLHFRLIPHPSLLPNGWSLSSTTSDPPHLPPSREPRHCGKHWHTCVVKPTH